MLLGPATTPRDKEVEKPTLRSPSLEMISDVQRGLTSEGVPWGGGGAGGRRVAVRALGGFSNWLLSDRIRG